MNSSVRGAFQRLKGKTGAEPGIRVFVIDNPRRWFEEAREKAKLTSYNWHDNRHTFCSRLAMAGVSLKTIQVLAGHKTISMSARYAHLAPNTLHSAVELIAVPTATAIATSQKEPVQNEEMASEEIIVCI